MKIEKLLVFVRECFYDVCILVVDDQFGNVWLFEVFFGEVGYQYVEGIIDLMLVLECMDSVLFDLMFFDMWMFVFDGLLVLFFLQEFIYQEGLQVIVLIV